LEAKRLTCLEKLKGLRPRMMFNKLRILAWEVSWKHFGSSGRPGRLLEGSWEALGRLMGLLGSLLEPLGTLSGALGGSG